MSPSSIDPNPILDTGCPRSVGGIQSALALCQALDIPFELENLDCEPFYHGYGMNCSEAKITVGVWRLPLSDLLGNPFTFSFYVVDGDGYLLVGNDVLQKAQLLNDEGLVVISQGGTSTTDNSIYFSSYHSPGNRTHLFAIPSQGPGMKSFFSSVRSLFAMPNLPLNASEFNEGRYCKWFAFKLHSFTHYQLSDMLHLCRQANILTPPLRQALKVALEKCTSCKTTGGPLNSKKVSFDKIIRELMSTSSLISFS